MTMSRSAARTLKLILERNAEASLHHQICTALREQIRTGELPAHARLPSTRALASDLGVSRSTIVLAFDQLKAEGFLDSTPGAGFTVCSIGEVASLPAGDAMRQPSANAVRPRERIPPTSNTRPFTPGHCDMRLFPWQGWSRCIARVARQTPERLLIPESTSGNHRLRAAIAAHLAGWRGMTVTAGQVLITAGASDALELCLRCLSAPGDGIGVEDPGYPPLHRLVQRLGLDTQSLARDADGTCLPTATIAASPACRSARPGESTQVRKGHSGHRLRMPSMIVVTPSHQYPLGGAMSATRRRSMVQWAQEHDAWILEDDYDSEYRYAGSPIPALYGFDDAERTIYIGSFSKLFANGLRLGYVVLPEPLVARFESFLQDSGSNASVAMQEPLAAFMEAGAFYRHLRRMRRIHGQRYRYMLDSLKAQLGEFGQAEDHDAGMQIAFHLDGHIDDRELARRGAEQGLELVPLSSHALEARNVNGLLLGFCAFDEREIDAGTRRLRKLLVQPS